MADTVIYIRDAKTGQPIPIQAKDNGDSTFNLFAATNAVISNTEVK